MYNYTQILFPVLIFAYTTRGLDIKISDTVQNWQRQTVLRPKLIVICILGIWNQLGELAVIG